MIAEYRRCVLFRSRDSHCPLNVTSVSFDQWNVFDFDYKYLSANRTIRFVTFSISPPFLVGTFFSYRISSSLTIVSIRSPYLAHNAYD